MCFRTMHVLSKLKAKNEEVKTHVLSLMDLPNEIIELILEVGNTHKKKWTKKIEKGKIKTQSRTLSL